MSSNQRNQIELIPFEKFDLTARNAYKRRLVSRIKESLESLDHLSSDDDTSSIDHDAAIAQKMLKLTINPQMQ